MRNDIERNEPTPEARPTAFAGDMSPRTARTVKYVDIAPVQCGESGFRALPYDEGIVRSRVELPADPAECDRLGGRLRQVERLNPDIVLNPVLPVAMDDAEPHLVAIQRGVPQQTIDGPV